MKQPPTVPGDEFWLTAFSVLSTERQFPGSGFGPIPWSRAFEFARDSQGFSREMCNFFAMVILILDGHYREHVVEEQKKEADKEQRQAKRQARVKNAKAGIGSRRRARQARGG